MLEFNVEQETNNCIEFIRNYYKENNLGGAVLGISGGKDSAVVAALMVKALGKENVVGLWIPCESKTTDELDSKRLSDFLGIETHTVDITEAYKSLSFNRDDEKYSETNINLKPRLRMSVVYYWASMLSIERGKAFIVPGTSNACELYVGYFTKGGDSVCDIKPIADFTVEQVIAIGDYLGLPEDIVHKTPDDGLSGKSDEDKLGFTYSDVASVINDNLDKVSTETINKIKHKHKLNRHKFYTPIYFKGGVEGEFYG